MFWTIAFILDLKCLWSLPNISVIVIITVRLDRYVVSILNMSATRYVIMTTYAVIESSFYWKLLMTQPLAQHRGLLYLVTRKEMLPLLWEVLGRRRPDFCNVQQTSEEGFRFDLWLWPSTLKPRFVSRSKFWRIETFEQRTRLLRLWKREI